MRTALELSPELFRPLVIHAGESMVTETLRSRGVEMVHVPVDRSLQSLYLRDSALWRPSNAAGVPVKLWRSGAVGRVTDVLKTRNVSLVYCCDNLGKVTGGLAARRAGIPCVGRLHDVLDRRPLGLLLAGLNLSVLDRIYAVSKAVYSSIARWPGAGGKAVLLYNGVDTDLFSPSAMPVEIPHETGDGRLIVGCVGALDTNKGQEVALEAMRQLRAAGFDRLRLWLVGVGPQEEALRRQARESGIERFVHFWGFRRDVPRLLAAMDLFAMPTTGFESLGVAAIEAMMMGLPVVASGLGGVPEVVVHDETGLLTEPGDPVALASALRRLAVDTSLRRAFGQQGRRRALRLFSRSQIQNRLEAEFRRMIRPPWSPPAPEAAAR